MRIVNGKAEVAEYVGQIQAARIWWIEDDDDEIFASRDEEAILAFLDREYDSGYGRQELDGTIWLKDGTWLERYEYDGSERWEHKAVPVYKGSE